MRHFIVTATCAVLAVVAGCGKPEPAPAAKPAERTRVGLVAKSLGNGFFDAVHRGVDEAARELDAEVIFTGPTTPTAEGQIEVLNALIAQHVDAIAVSANDPDALVPTLRKAMERAGKKVSDFDVVEVNEAFAPQYLACEKELGLDRERTNVNGGAIALGHPLGASGARITAHLCYELKRRGKKLGIGSACIGGGQGIAIIVEAA